METKIQDAEEHVKDLEEDTRREVNRMREVLKLDEKKIIKHIRKARQKAARAKRALEKKHKEKKTHTRKKRDKQKTKDKEKRDKNEQRENDVVPEDLKEFRGLEIFTLKDLEEEEKKQVEQPSTEDVLSIGVDLSTEERSVLCLPPKTSLNPSLSGVDFETQVEISFAKARYSLRDALEEEDGQGEDKPQEDKELEQKIKEVEARTRMIYDDATGTLDLAKRRVTDLPQNSKVFLPPPLPATTEAGLAVKKQKLMSTLDQFMEKNCDSKGKQRASSLNASQKQGLASLKRRSKEGELFILETDKTNKFAAVDQDTYLKMGGKHTDKDLVISPQEAEAVQAEANGHVSMWIKMLGMGEAWGHGPRIRESLIQQSCVVPPMKLLVKDHKKVPEDGVPPTRPVVSASKGINVGLSNIISDVLEPLSRGIKDSGEVISTEHLLNEINSLNQEWKAGGANPEDMPKLIAADAEALYPSLDAGICSKVVREECIRSDMEVDNTNWQEMARYIAMTSDPWEWKQWQVAQFIPKRAFTRGHAPGITGKEAMGADLGSNQWVFPIIAPCKFQLKLLLAACLGIGVRATFRLHTYTFGGKLFQQLSGGPIGLRLTCCVARLRIIAWLVEVLKRLVDAGIKIFLAKFYVDDIRLVLSLIAKGW
ncbi:MAG: hypothetical protein GY782_01110, partial [Gammaproteobacteria bacterium]|nr:hypothetical protein [Gammaproteobacteria bacterium]